MLYQIGLLSIRANGFSAERVRRSARADFAVKPVVGGRKPREAIGIGDDSLTLSGKLLPFKLGGLTELDIAHGMMASQIPQPVLRGDGRVLGYHVLEEIEEDHQNIEPNGVGFELDYTIKTQRVPPPITVDAAAIVGGLVSLFRVLRG